MKKALIGLLVLAIAGGSAFAQGWTFNGLATGGFGMFFFEDDAEDVRVAPINWDAANQGFRTQLDARFVNADQTGGLTFRIRAQGFGATGAGGLPAFFDWGFGWLSFADNMITVQGGRVEYGFFAPLDRMFHQEVGGGVGVQTIIRPPVEGLVLGFGAFSAGNGLMTLDGAEITNAAGVHVGYEPQWLGTFQLSYLVPNTVRVTAGARTATDVGTSGFGASRMAGIGSPNRAANPSAAYVSFAWLGTPDLHAAFTARFMNLEEFGDYGDMRFYATFGHTGLVDGLDLRLGFSFGMTMEDNVYRNIGTAATPNWYANDDPAPHIWVWLSAAYALTERVIPRLDVHYVMGGQWNGFQRMHHWSVRDGATFNEDDSFIQIRPAVQFRVTPASYVELGGIFNIDLSEQDPHTGAPATWSAPSSWGRVGAGNGTNIGAYALVRVSF